MNICNFADLVLAMKIYCTKPCTCAQTSTHELLLDVSDSRLPSYEQTFDRYIKNWNKMFTDGIIGESFIGGHATPLACSIKHQQ